MEPKGFRAAPYVYGTFRKEILHSHHPNIRTGRRGNQPVWLPAFRRYPGCHASFLSLTAQVYGQEGFWMTGRIWTKPGKPQWRQMSVLLFPGCIRKNQKKTVTVLFHAWDSGDTALLKVFPVLSFFRSGSFIWSIPAGSPAMQTGAVRNLDCHTARFCTAPIFVLCTSLQVLPWACQVRFDILSEQVHDTESGMQHTDRGRAQKEARGTCFPGPGSGGFTAG